MMKNRIFNLIFAIHCVGAFNAEAAIPVRGYQIDQERLSQNGVLISRPAQIDEKIVQMVNQNGIRTIEDYAAWLANNTTYQSDGHVDQWMDPADFFKTKRGDCEDFALFNARALKVLGYRANVLTLNAPGKAHAICAFQYNGRFYWFDNDLLKTSSATSLVSFAQEVTEQLHYSSSSELDPKSKQINLIYQRS